MQEQERKDKTASKHHEQTSSTRLERRTVQDRTGGDGTGRTDGES
jgi:hypothetical protein